MYRPGRSPALALIWFVNAVDDGPGQISNKNITDPLGDLYCRGVHHVQSARSLDFGNRLICTCSKSRLVIFLFGI